MRDPALTLAQLETLAAAALMGVTEISFGYACDAGRIDALAAIPGAERRVTHIIVAGVVREIDAVEVTVNGVRFRAQRDYPASVQVVK